MGLSRRRSVRSAATKREGSVVLMEGGRYNSRAWSGHRDDVLFKARLEITNLFQGRYQTGLLARGVLGFVVDRAYFPFARYGFWQATYEHEHRHSLSIHPRMFSTPLFILLVPLFLLGRSAPTFFFTRQWTTRELSKDPIHPSNMTNGRSSCFVVSVSGIPRTQRV